MLCKPVSGRLACSATFNAVCLEYQYNVTPGTVREHVEKNQFIKVPSKYLAYNCPRDLLERKIKKYVVMFKAHGSGTNLGISAPISNNNIVYAIDRI